MPHLDILFFDFSRMIPLSQSVYGSVPFSLILTLQRIEDTPLFSQIPFAFLLSILAFSQTFSNESETRPPTRYHTTDMHDRKIF